MPIKQDIEESLKDCEVMKINGQPIDEDVNKLKQELTTIAASILTFLRGGGNGHIRMLLGDTKYIAFSIERASFAITTNPGAAPMNISTDAVA